MHFYVFISNSIIFMRGLIRKGFTRCIFTKYCQLQSFPYGIETFLLECGFENLGGGVGIPGRERGISQHVMIKIMPIEVLVMPHKDPHSSIYYMKPPLWLSILSSAFMWYCLSSSQELKKTLYFIMKFFIRSFFPFFQTLWHDIVTYSDE